jgi:sugar phosphate isomerase/epimerase
MVRVFSFLRRTHPSDQDDLKRAASHFPRLIQLAEAAGLIVGLENEGSCIVGSGREMHRFLQHLPPSPALGVVWDPCNVLFLPGEDLPFPDEYEQVADRVIHVHVKDARREGSAPVQECVELGHGGIDYPGQFAALRARGYAGWVTLETHWRAARRLSADSQHLPAGHAFSDGGEATSRICMAHLQRMLQA